jgi:hypothetical protein
MAVAWVLVLVSACGGSTAQAPQFQEAFGTLDSPCSLSAPAATSTTSCTAHVLLVNRGGEGVGHATMLVVLKDAKTGVSSQVRCGRSIPDTPAGNYVDLACVFSVPAGSTIGAVPAVQGIDYSAAVPQSTPATDYASITVWVLAGAVLVVCLATLLLAVRPRSTDSPREKHREAPQQPRPSKRDGPDAEYNFPTLPQ